VSQSAVVPEQVYLSNRLKFPRLSRCRSL